jgi:hypothetical protein
VFSLGLTQARIEGDTAKLWTESGGRLDEENNYPLQFAGNTRTLTDPGCLVCRGGSAAPASGGVNPSDPNCDGGAAGPAPTPTSTYFYSRNVSVGFVAVVAVPVVAFLPPVHRWGRALPLAHTLPLVRSFRVQGCGRR